MCVCVSQVNDSGQALEEEQGRPMHFTHHRLLLLRFECNLCRNRKEEVIIALAGKKIDCDIERKRNHQDGNWRYRVHRTYIIYISNNYR